MILFSGIAFGAIALGLTLPAVAQPNGQAIQLAKYRPEMASKNLDFQIRIDLYSDESKPPINSLQTIFTNGLSIEFNDQQGRYTIVDAVKGRVTLLDKERKILLHMEMQSIETQLDRAVQLMSPEQQSAFSCDGPPVQEADNTFSIGNAFIRYRFTPIEVKPEIATRYGEFTDWVSRIYALQGPKMPPQIRLELNQLLVANSQLPSVLRRTIQYGPNAENKKSEEIVARLNVTESLSDSDRSRVAGVYKWMQEFKPASESGFFQ
jgi:hypothetical protein